MTSDARAPGIPADEVARVRQAVLAWYAGSRRSFPWRATTDPYAVLVSEVMLQQTQASRVAPRYERFMARFPTAEELAAAEPGSVLAEWAGLGYNRRALALQRTARHVAEHGWPADVRGLERLPGVGAYTARAVASLAFGIPTGVVDTNVRRWLVRRFGTTARPAALQLVADALAAAGEADDVAAWTHATMELGAAACRARSPLCSGCPLADGCPSRGRAEHVPVPRQPRLAGSDRELRGRIVRLLAAATAHRRPARELRAGIGLPTDDGQWERVMAALQRDGMVHRAAGDVVLGAATIAP